MPPGPRPRRGLTFRVGLTFLLLLPAALGLDAQTVVVTRNVNLRRDPSATQPPIRLLRPSEELALEDTVKVHNYYPVYRAESDEHGWVWAHNVAIVTAAGVPLPDGDATGRVDSLWVKPAPASSIFRSPVRDTTCGPVGDGGDTATNRLKNRVDIPDTVHAVTLDALLQLPYPATGASSRLAWPAESLARVRRFEGVPVRVVGYLVAIKPQTGGSGETTNCHLTRAAEVDWHLAIVPTAGQGEADALVIETTPRLRLEHPQWTKGRLDPWVDANHPVRISGWLLFDPVHRNHLGRYRATLWEIHPITRIEVWRDDAWVDLDDLP